MRIVIRPPSADRKNCSLSIVWLSTVSKVCWISKDLVDRKVDIYVQVVGRMLRTLTNLVYLKIRIKVFVWKLDLRVVIFVGFLQIYSEHLVHLSSQNFVGDDRVVKKRDLHLIFGVQNLWRAIYPLWIRGVVFKGLLLLSFGCLDGDSPGGP